MSCLCVYTGVSSERGAERAWGGGSALDAVYLPPSLPSIHVPITRSQPETHSTSFEYEEPPRTFLLLPGERWVCVAPPYTVLVPLREGEAPVFPNFWERKVCLPTLRTRSVVSQPSRVHGVPPPPRGLPGSPSPCEYNVCPTAIRGAAVSESLRIRGAYVLPPKRGRLMPSVLSIRYWYAAPAPPPPSRTA